MFGVRHDLAHRETELNWSTLPTPAEIYDRRSRRGTARQELVAGLRIARAIAAMRLTVPISGAMLMPTAAPIAPSNEIAAGKCKGDEDRPFAGAVGGVTCNLRHASLL
jgi:hypothetical protein